MVGADTLPMPELLLPLVKYFEGFEPLPYACAGGYETIGYGHRCVTDMGIKGPVTEAAATALLIQDLHRMSLALQRLCAKRIQRTPLTLFQRVALLSFIFNVGPGAFQRSTLRLKVNRGDDIAATQEFQRWIWAGGRKRPGLVMRRRIEADLFAGHRPGFL